MRKSPSKIIPLGLSLLLLSQPIFAYSIETNFWKERKKLQQKNGPIQLAQISSNFKPPPFPNRFSSAINSDIRQSLPPGFEQQYKPILDALPYSYGQIRRIKVPKDKSNGKTVIHIQDIHLHQEAQRNIGKTIQALIDKEAVDLVAMEGIFNPVYVNHFHSVPDRQNIDVVADYLLRENKISGALFTALTSRQKIPAYVGVDDEHHYWENVSAYKEASHVAKEAASNLKKYQNDLNRRKKRLLNKELLDFDEKVQAYRENKLPFPEYAKLLATRSGGLSQRLQTFLKALELEETLDFHAIEAERSRVIDRLIQKSNQKQISHLLYLSQGYRSGDVRYSDLYQLIEALCGKNNVDLTQYPKLRRYIDYVSLSEKINGESLLSETKRLEIKFYSTLIKTKEEKAIVDKSYAATLLSKLLNFELTPSEWEDYQKLNKARLTNADLTPFEAFYKHAKTRDKKMSRNLLHALKTNNSNIGVVIAGGFHSNGLEKILIDSGATVITFTPRMTKVETKEGSSYLSSFSQEKTPLEYLFDEEKLFVTPVRWNAETQLLLANGYTAAGNPRSPSQAKDRFSRIIPSVQFVTTVIKDGITRIKAVGKNLSSSADVKWFGGKIHGIYQKVEKIKGTENWRLLNEQIKPFSIPLLSLILIQTLTFSSGPISILLGSIFGLLVLILHQRQFVFTLHKNLINRSHEYGMTRDEMILGLTQLYWQIGILSFGGSGLILSIAFLLPGYALTFPLMTLIQVNAFIFGHFIGGLWHESRNILFTHKLLPSLIRFPGSSGIERDPQEELAESLYQLVHQSDWRSAVSSPRKWITRDLQDLNIDEVRNLIPAIEGNVGRTRHERFNATVIIEVTSDEMTISVDYDTPSEKSGSSITLTRENLERSPGLKKLFEALLLRGEAPQTIHLPKRIGNPKTYIPQARSMVQDSFDQNSFPIKYLYTTEGRVLSEGSIYLQTYHPSLKESEGVSQQDTIHHLWLPLVYMGKFPIRPGTQAVHVFLRAVPFDWGDADNIDRLPRSSVVVVENENFHRHGIVALNTEGSISSGFFNEFEQLFPSESPSRRGVTTTSIVLNTFWRLTNLNLSGQGQSHPLSQEARGALFNSLDRNLGTTEFVPIARNLIRPGMVIIIPGQDHPSLVVNDPTYFRLITDEGIESLKQGHEREDDDEERIVGSFEPLSARNLRSDKIQLVVPQGYPDFYDDHKIDSGEQCTSCQSPEIKQDGPEAAEVHKAIRIHSLPRIVDEIIRAVPELSVDRNSLLEELTISADMLAEEEGASLATARRNITRLQRAGVPFLKAYSPLGVSEQAWIDFRAELILSVASRDLRLLTIDTNTLLSSLNKRLPSLNIGPESIRGKGIVGPAIEWLVYISIGFITAGVMLYFGVKNPLLIRFALIGIAVIWSSGYFAKHHFKMTWAQIWKERIFLKNEFIIRFVAGLSMAALSFLPFFFAGGVDLTSLQGFIHSLTSWEYATLLNWLGAGSAYVGHGIYNVRKEIKENIKARSPRLGVKDILSPPLSNQSRPSFKIQMKLKGYLASGRSA